MSNENQKTGELHVKNLLKTNGYISFEVDGIYMIANSPLRNILVLTKVGSGTQLNASAAEKTSLKAKAAQLEKEPWIAKVVVEQGVITNNITWDKL